VSSTTSAERARLRELVAACVSQGEVTLASGAKSDFYIDGRQVTLTPEGSLLLGRAIVEACRERKVTALGGPVTGACPLVTAAGVIAAQQGLALKLFYVRSEPKGHGLQKAIEGPPLARTDRALIVDDVITSGGSIIKAVERVRAEAECEVVGALCVVDRESGGREVLARAGIELWSLLSRRDLKPV
jgi:orotate phosphoribosyltransferase